MRAEVVTDGVVFGEGPVWVPEGTPGGPSLVVDERRRGITDPDLARRLPTRTTSPTPAAARTAPLAADGSILVTQNGGIDFSQLPASSTSTPPYVGPATPGLQLATPTATVAYLADDGFNAPNDLAIAADGDVFFTDPGHYPPPEPSSSAACWATNATARVRTLADGFYFCNGIAFEPDGDARRGRGPRAAARCIPTAPASG